jgi:hypothetical protein
MQIHGTFRKTAAGLAEIDGRAMGIRTELRRLLILIDGKRSIESLVPFVRENELQMLLDELLAFNFIEPTLTAAAFLPTGTTVTDVARPLSLAQFQAARSTAHNAAKELLGSEAKPYLAKILKCEDSRALRGVVSEVQIRLIHTLGDDAARIFIETIRRNSGAA